MATIPDDQSCASCAAWISDDDETGNCQRRPPLVVFTGRFESAGGPGISASLFAVTSKDWWCYEWVRLTPQTLPE